MVKVVKLFYAIKCMVVGGGVGGGGGGHKEVRP